MMDENCIPNKSGVLDKQQLDKGVPCKFLCDLFSQLFFAKLPGLIKNGNWNYHLTSRAGWVDGYSTVYPMLALLHVAQYAYIIPCDRFCIGVYIVFYVYFQGGKNAFDP